MISFVLIREIKALKTHNQILKWNLESIIKKQSAIQLANGKIANDCGVLSLKQNELKELFPVLKKELENLKIQTRKTEFISSTGFNATKHFTALLIDSIPPLEGKDTSRYKSFTYKDNYYCIQGLIKDSIQMMDIQYTDTLTQIIYRKRKHKWLWIFSPKELNQRAALSNPNAHIQFEQSIKIIR